MDIIAYPRPVVGWVITPEYRQLLEFPHGYLCDVGHQVIGDVIRVFADAPALVSSHGIEIAQESYIPLLTGGMKVTQNFLNKQFCSTIRISSLKREILLYRHRVGIAIDCGGRAENQIENPMFLHHLTETECAGNVIMIIGKGMANRFSHRFIARKMNDGINLMTFKNVM